MAMEPDQVVREFTHQSESFNVAPVMRSADTLGRLVDLIPAAPGERWLDAACGPGLVARGLAPRVGQVHGVDMTPAMVDVARRESAADGIGNAAFSVGDATALGFVDGAFDGAVTRFSLHHIPVPGRVVEELARVVRPGGAVVLADHVTSPDADEQEIPISIDYEEWIARGSGGPASAGLIARALADRVAAPDVFRVVDRGDGRRLELRYWISVWRTA
jgi:SAM-dependent methyltransferase